MLNIIRENPVAFILAVFVHLLLGAFLTFNMDWNAKHEVTAPTANVIKAVMIDESKIRAEKERLKKLKDDKQRKIEQERKRKDAEKRRKKEAEKEHKKQVAEKKRKIAAEKKRKADAEKKRKLEAQRKKEAADKKRQAELEKKREIEKERLRKLEVQKREREAEMQRLKAEEDALRQQQMAEEQAVMNAARQKALLSERSKYINLIQNRVASKWAKPSGWRPGIQCTVRVRLVPGAGVGRVMDVQIVKSTGNPLFDRSVENAVFSASPLPIPTSPELINEFRDITFNFKPEG